MNRLLPVSAILCVLALSGCATGLSFRPVLDQNTAPASGNGYVAGLFSHDWEPGKTTFGLGIVNTATADEYVLPFGFATEWPTTATDVFAMTSLPPGKYKVAHWLSYTTKGQDVLTRTDVAPGSSAVAPFTLAPGEVVFVGSYVARNVEAGKPYDEKAWTVHSQRLTRHSVEKLLSKRYPLFTTQTVSCPGCIE
jgi:hypothetical protein